jgi:hypothetical protein
MSRNPSFFGFVSASAEVPAVARGKQVPLPHFAAGCHPDRRSRHRQWSLAAGGTCRQAVFAGIAPTTSNAGMKL